MEGVGVGVGGEPGIKLHPARETRSRLRVRGRIFFFMESSFDLVSNSVIAFVQFSFRRYDNADKRLTHL
jgi:hypothetical protein